MHSRRNEKVRSFAVLPVVRKMDDEIPHIDSHRSNNVLDDGRSDDP